MRIRVISPSGTQQTRVCDFDQAGGSIGRSDNNRLVLPDPERYISRLHARIVFEDGGFSFVDEGNNPTLVNGTPLGKGNAFKLQVDDQLQIGDYRLVVESVAPIPEMASPTEVSSVAGAPTDINDSLGLLEGGAAPSPGKPAPAADPSADLLGLLGAASPEALPSALMTANRSSLSQPAPAASRPGHQGGIPEDFDPFGEAPEPEPRKNPGAAPSPLDDFFETAPQAPGKGSIDALFGLEPGQSKDPFAGSPLGEGLPADRGGASDILSVLGPGQKGSPAPMPDNVPELRSAYVPPPAQPERQSRSPPAAPVREAPDKTSPRARMASPDPPRQEMFVSWQGEGPGGTGGISRVTVESRGPAPPPGPRNAPPAAPKAGRAEAAVQPGRVEGTAPADPDELLQALLRGLGVKDLPVPRGLTPELMGRLGSLLRESTQGTLDLLLARAMTKREVHAPVTMISARDNNPLKFSPDVAVALTHLLAPQSQGFLQPVAAMRDAYNDLKAHQFGFMAGMRAALVNVLARFNPQTLEKKLMQKSMLDSVLPMNRRAKLWELYTEMYEDIANEAEEDFHSLFGREFLRAYEEQIAKLDNPPPGQGGPPGKKG